MIAGVGTTDSQRLAEAEESAQRLHDMRQLALVLLPAVGFLPSMRNTTPQTLAYSQYVLEEAQKLGDAVTGGAGLSSAQSAIASPGTL